jgi:pilus assembly protein CpaE
MAKPLILIVGAEGSVQAEITRSLREIANLSSVNVESGTGLQDALSMNPGAIIAAIGYPFGASFPMVAELASAGARVIVVSPTKDPDLILQAMRAGAREFVMQSDEDGLRRAVREQAKPSEDPGPRGSAITLFPTRGGVGATSIATNLAGALQRRGERVCLLDFDLHLGDVLSFLDLPGTYSITDVLTNMGRLDRDLLDASVMRHPSGIRVLAQSGKVEEADQIRHQDVAQLLGFLRKHYDRIVVDGVRGFDELSLAVLDASQKLLMVLTQDVPAVRNTKRCLDLFRRLGYGDTKVQLILNRYQRDSKITPEVIADTVGLPVSHTLSNDFASAIESINRGLLLYDIAPRSKLTKDIELLAPLLSGQPPSGGRRTAGFFRSLLSKKGEDGSTGTT